MDRRPSFFDHLPHPAIIAHRGASRAAPENTLAAFKLAVEQGAHALELDAKLCADGEVVVMHDDRVERTTDGRGKVKDLSLADLKKLNAGAHFKNNYPAEKIPTLAEVFTAVGGQTFINVELTNYASPFDELPLKAAELVRKHRLEERILFSSFNIIALFKIGKVLPRTARALLASPGTGAYWKRASFVLNWLGCLAFHPEIRDVKPDLVAAMHRRNFRINVYTVNDRADINHVTAMGVDGIFTDDVRLAKECIGVGKG